VPAGGGVAGWRVAGSGLGRDRAPGHHGPAAPVTVAVRPATTADRAGILAVVGDAFSYGGTRDSGAELAIVRDTWSAQAGRPLLELVAAEDGTLVGHLQAAPGRLDGRATAAAGVAPVCVASAHQGRGAGSALMAALIGAAEELHWPLLVLLGDPAYYSRFGFEAAAPLGLNYPPAGAGNRHFQARRLPGSSSALQGEFGYCWE
jgi:putative acetyltransferase